jgi:hypothetical protein
VVCKNLFVCGFYGKNFSSFWLYQKQEIMPNKCISMSKLRTIIRLYEERTGFKTIAYLVRTSRNTVKKYIHTWNTLDMSYEDFQRCSDSELHELFCVSKRALVANPCLEAFEQSLPAICKDLSRNGINKK